MARLIDAKTIPEALALAKKMSGKIGANEEKKIRALYEKYKVFIDKYRGALPPLSVAQGLMHESVGDPEHTSDPIIGESGLWSILPGQALGNDFDPFDPEANIWAGGRLRNERIKEILDKWPWLKDSDPRDYTTITQKMPGSLGLGGFKTMMRVIFPSEPTGERRKYPYRYMQSWVANSANWGKIPTLGRQKPPLVAGRIYRDIAGEWLESIGQLAVPGQYALIPRPSHLPKFNPERWAKLWGKKVAAMAKSSDKLYQGWYKKLVEKLGADKVKAMAGGTAGSWGDYLNKVKKGALSVSAEEAIDAIGEAVTSPFAIAGLSLGTVAILGAVGVGGVYLWHRSRARRGTSPMSGLEGATRATRGVSGRECGVLKKSALPDSEFDPEQLRRGIDVEMEHSESRSCAKAIAKAHLVEHPRYYDFLDEMERKMRSDKGLGAFGGMFSEGERTPLLPHEPDPWDIDPLLTSPGLRRAAARKERAEQRAAEKKQTLFRRAERRPILPKAPEELSALEYTCKERCGDLMGDRKAYRACLDSCVEGGGWKKPKGEMYGAFSSMFGDAIDDRIETAPIAELQAIRKDLNAAIKGGQYQTEIGGQRVLIPVVLGKVNARLKSLNALAGDSGLTCTCRGKTVVKPIQLRFLSCESFCKGK